jgi:hypothetical protein
MRTPLFPIVALLVSAAWAAAPLRAEVTAEPASPDSSQVIDFFPPDSNATPAAAERAEKDRTPGDERWLRTPFGDRLLTPAEAWRERSGVFDRVTPVFDYNRVDPLRLGFGYELQDPQSLHPRFGARLEYAFGRDRVLYGVQIEQPLARPGRIAAGISMVRRTDHSDLQQVEDAENSLALLLGRQDYRDYFEREGIGGYLSWWVPDFSTVSVHLRRDTYRSLETSPRTRSWFHTSRPLRDNPAIDEGDVHGVTLRLERLAHRTRSMRAGLYHWIEIERAGRGLGGDFEYTRALADVRSILRLSPATTLMLRGVAASGLDGTLPVQKQFTLGGVDGLRAHSFDQYRGNQLALAQAEYVVGLWHIRSRGFEGGLHAIAFVDAGRAWDHPGGAWDIGRQHIQADGGFGLGTSEDNLRVYFARNLQDSKGSTVISVRLQRPF